MTQMQMPEMVLGIETRKIPELRVEAVAIDGRPYRFVKSLGGRAFYQALNDLKDVDEPLVAFDATLTIVSMLLPTCPRETLEMLDEDDLVAILDAYGELSG